MSETDSSTDSDSGSLMSDADCSDFSNVKTGFVIFLILPHFELLLDVFIVSYSSTDSDSGSLMSDADCSDFSNVKTGFVIFLILPHFELLLDVFIVSYSCNNNSYLFFAAACFDKRSLLIFLFSRVEANNTNKSFKFELNSIRVFSYSAEKSNGNFF